MVLVGFKVIDKQWHQFGELLLIKINHSINFEICIMRLTPLKDIPHLNIRPVEEEKPV